MLFDQKMPGAISLASTFSKLLAAFMFIPGVLSFPPPPAFISTENSSNALFHWTLHRAGLRSKPVFQPDRADQVATSDSFERIISPAITPNNTFSTSGVSSNEGLRTAFVTPTHSEKLVPKVVDDRVNKTRNTLSPLLTATKDQMVLLASPKINGAKDVIAHSNMVTPTHKVPYTIQNAVIVPNSQSNIPKQEEITPHLTSSSNFRPQVSSHTNSFLTPDITAKPPSNDLSESKLSKELSGRSEKVDVFPSSSSVTRAESEASFNGGDQNQKITSNQNVLGASSVLQSTSSYQGSSVSQIYGTPTSATIQTNEFGFSDYSSMEDTDTRKEEVNPVSGEDSSELFIVSMDEKGNVFGMTVTRKAGIEREGRRNSQQSTTRTAHDGESREGRRANHRRRGGRKRNRRRSTTTLPITEAVTVVPSFNNGNTLKWTVATPMPTMEERRRHTRDTSGDDGAVTSSDAGEMSKTILYQDDVNNNTEGPPQVTTTRQPDSVTDDSRSDNNQSTANEMTTPKGPTTQPPEPLKPLNLTLIPCSRTINVSFTELSETDVYFQYCNYSVTDEASCGTWANSSLGSHEILIQNLEPNTNYTVVVRAVRLDDDASVNVTSSAVTLFDIAVTNLTIDSVTNNTARINVSTIGPASSINYRVTVESTSTENELAKKGSIDDLLPNGGDFSIDVVGLHPCRNYTMAVWPSSSCFQDSSKSFEKTTRFKTHIGAIVVQNLTVSNPTPGSPAVEVSWKPPSTECVSDIIGYKVRWHEMEDKSADGLELIGAGNPTILLNLTYHKIYTIYVAVVTEARILMEVSTTVITPMARLPIPADLTLTPCSRSINVSYTKFEDTSKGNVSYYQYCYYVSDEIACNAWVNQSVGCNQFQIEDLQPNTTYTVVVRAVSDGNREPLEGENATQTTTTFPDTAVVDLTIDAVTNNSAMLNGSTVGPTSSVSYRLTPVHGVGDTMVTNSKFSTELLGLVPCTNYTVEVRSLSNCSKDISKDSSQRTFRTHLGVATVVGNLHAEALVAGSNTANVSWTRPDTECWENISHYEVRWYKTGIEKEDLNVTQTNNDVFRVTLTSLQYNTHYTIEVAAFTRVSQQSEPLEGEVKSTPLMSRMKNPPKPPNLDLAPCSRIVNVTYGKVPEENIDRYEYCYKVTDETACNKWENDNSENNIFTIENLKPKTDYTVNVRAVRIDDGTPLYSESAESTIATLSDIKVIDLTIDGVTSKAARISGVTDGPTLSVGYRITSKAGSLEESTTTFNNAKFSADLSGLLACTNYTVEVWPSSSCSRNNSKSHNLTQSFKTGVGVALVQDLNAKKTTSESPKVVVSWARPAECVDDVVQYNVSWYVTEDESDRGFELTDAQTFSLTLDLKNYYKNYTIKVAYVTIDSVSLEAVTTVITRMAKPEIPQDLTRTACSRNINFTYYRKTAWSGGVIELYEYCYNVTTSPNCETWNTIADDHVEVQNLLPNTSYTIQLRAVSFDDPDLLHSDPRIVVVSTLPDIDVKDLTVTNRSNDQAQFFGTTTGPVAAVYWKYRIAEANEEEKWSDEAVADLKNSSFSISMPNLMNCSKYTVELRVTSECSQTESKYSENFKTLSALPPVVGELMVTTKSRAASITWAKPEDFRCEIINYVITYKAVNNYHDKDGAVQMNSSTPGVGLRELHPYTNYNVSVVAETNGGKGLQRDYSFITNTTDPVKPESVNINDCTSQECNVTWSMPASENGPRNFTIYCNSSDAALTRTNFEPFSVEDENRPTFKIFSSRVLDLQPYTMYVCHVVVAIKEEENHSEESEAVRTSPDVPDKPSDFHVQCSIGNNPGQAKWSMPPISKGVVSNFTIKYTGEREDVASAPECQNITTFDALDTRSYSLKLVPECNYSFSIVAYNWHVDSPSVEATSPTCFQNAAKPPLPNQDAIVKIEGEKDSAVISFRRDLFSEDNGKIRNYSMIMYTGKKREDITDVTPKNWQAVYFQEEIEPYVVTHPGWNPFSGNPAAMGRSGLGYSAGKETCCVLTKDEEAVECTLGCDKTCGKDPDKNIPCNGPLHPHTTYYVVIRGFTNGGFTDTQPKEFTTGEKNKTAVNATLGVALALLAIIIVIGIFIHYRRNDLRKLFFIKPSVESGTQTSSLTISNRSITRPETVADFQAYYLTMAADSGLKFAQEYEELKAASPVLPKTAAQLLENRAKNRWINILPFDQTRVKLLPISDDVTTDYINACYIPGVNSPREYIATQGPLPGTKDDFWRMVWEQNSQMIVMVTQLVERGKVKCEQYWPDDRDVHYYGDLAVQLRSESILSGFTIRIFDLNLGTRSLEVKQMHFTKWPDFGCPENTSLLINFVRAVREHLPHENTGPIIAHCSAGVGRTGTFIAVDRLIEHLETHDYVDIYGVVLDMRNYRVNMVQTEDQYVYIHECIRDFLITAQEITDDGDAIYQNVSGITKSRDSQL